jgi:hypothetical protein
MKTCPKCHGEFDDEAYGHQVYCRQCWRTYNNDRMKIRRLNRRRDKEREKLEEQLAYLASLSPERAAIRRAEYEAEGRL